MSERCRHCDAAAEILDYHGCASGDCPHAKQSECFAALVEAGYARALKEMAKIMREKDAHRDHLLDQLAAAQVEVERLSRNCEVKDKNKKRLERMYGELEQQLAAAELKAGEFEKALENIPSQDGISWSIARKVLKAHTRPTKEAERGRE